LLVKKEMLKFDVGLNVKARRCERLFFGLIVMGLVSVKRPGITP
jgi:hypothetical protein